MSQIITLNLLKLSQQQIPFRWASFYMYISVIVILRWSLVKRKRKREPTVIRDASYRSAEGDKAIFICDKVVSKLGVSIARIQVRKNAWHAYDYDTQDINEFLVRNYFSCYVFLRYFAFKQLINRLILWYPRNYIFFKLMRMKCWKSFAIPQSLLSGNSRTMNMRMYIEVHFSLI